MSKKRRRSQDNNALALPGQTLVDPADLEGALDLAVLERPVPDSGKITTALARIPVGRMIGGDRTIYAVCGERIYNMVKGEHPPMVSGMVVFHVPLDRKEILKCMVWGWDEAAKEIKDIADQATTPATKAAAISGLLKSANRELAYATDMDGHTRYAHDMGYRMGLRYELLKYPDLMVLMPHGGVQGQGGKNKDVQSEIEAHQQPLF